MMFRTSCRSLFSGCAGRSRLLAGFSASTRNYYHLLGLTPNAQAEEIREAYKRLAKEYHPSLFSEAAQSEALANFRLLAEAYAVLSDPARRVQYDVSQEEQDEPLSDDPRPEVLRGVEGVPLVRVTGVDKSGFAESYRQQIKEVKQRFNIDEIGNFKGGLPMQGRGKWRGDSVGAVGEFAEPSIIRSLQYKAFKTELIVDQNVVEEFKNMKTNDRKAYEQPWTWWRVSVNYGSPLKNNEFFFRVIRGALIIYFLIYLVNYIKTLTTTGIQNSLKEAKPEQILSVGSRGEKVVKVAAGQVLIDENGVARLL